MPQAFSFQLLAEKAWFNPLAIQVRFLWNKVPLGPVFLQVLQFSHQMPFHQYSLFTFIHLALMSQSRYCCHYTTVVSQAKKIKYRSSLLTQLLPSDKCSLIPLHLQNRQDINDCHNSVHVSEHVKHVLLSLSCVVFTMPAHNRSPGILNEKVYTLPLCAKTPVCQSCRIILLQSGSSAYINKPFNLYFQ
jgi:hypothetical protein